MTVLRSEGEYRITQPDDEEISPQDKDDAILWKGDSEGGRAWGAAGTWNSYIFTRATAPSGARQWTETLYEGPSFENAINALWEARERGNYERESP